MIQIKLFNGPLSSIQEELNVFLKLSNIEYVDLKIVNDNQILLIYEYIEPTKWNDLIAHISENVYLREEIAKKIKHNL
jgi:hypothetical protein